ncbi:hypothetical protein Pla52o_41470 [Novipirellula galeiformis]|uniref:Transporter suffix domain-containing protein n=1 Tax=Novipirellula galeiformis TaxID=2528004 RepID=A0A5C6C8T2_9BACT|nr:transporter suffix domain-containing protein [Novipirellula galeiformis]TWU21113.1 hypothetical protein Pla52o_41470 [Novipirellula galeiformis]
MSHEPSQIRWRAKVGFVMFVLSIGWPVLIPVLPLLGVTTTATAAISGVMLVAAEIILVAAAAIAGKEGFAIIKTTVFGFLHSRGPANEVGPTRYRIGLVMFAAPLAVGWASPYIGHYFAVSETDFGVGGLAAAIVLDVLLLVSLFVLGGGFWDKLRSLLRHDAYAVIPDKRLG